MTKYKDSRLAKLALEGGKFIKLDVGDSFVGTYLTWRSEMDDKYHKTKVVFTFRTEKGEEKTLSTSAKKVIGKMAMVIPGSQVQLTKLGVDRNLDYSVKVLAEGTAPSMEEPNSDEEKNPVVEEEEEEEEEDEGEENLF
jgi:hypothetical protein